MFRDFIDTIVSEYSDLDKGEKQDVVMWYAIVLALTPIMIFLMMHWLSPLLDMMFS